MTTAISSSIESSSVSSSVISKGVPSIVRTKKSNKPAAERTKAIQQRVDTSAKQFAAFIDLATAFDSASKDASKAVDKAMQLFVIKEKEDLVKLTGFLADKKEWPAHNNVPISINTILSSKGKWSLNKNADFYFLDGKQGETCTVKGQFARLVNAINKRFYKAVSKPAAKDTRIKVNAESFSTAKELLVSLENKGNAKVIAEILKALSNSAK